MCIRDRHDVVREVCRALEAQLVPAWTGGPAEQRPDPVDVPLDDVAAEARVRANGTLEVHRRAGAKVAEGAAPQRLGHHVGAEGAVAGQLGDGQAQACLLYTSPSPRDGLLSRMPS